MSLKAALCQTEPHIGETGGNVEEMARLVRATEAGIYLFCELATSGYSLTPEELKECALTPDDPRLAPLREAAAEQDALLVFGFPERGGSVFFNSQLALFPGGGSAVYRKVHLFDTEKELFEPGRELVTFDFPGGRFGMMVCYDWAFCELARTLTLRGAQILLSSANFVTPHGPDVMHTRAVENRVWTLFANRCGEERGLTFRGGSRAVSPGGEVVAELGPQPDVAVLEIDPSLADDKQLTSRNHLLEDRRPDLYSL